MNPQQCKDEPKAKAKKGATAGAGATGQKGHSGGGSAGRNSQVAYGLKTSDPSNNLTLTAGAPLDLLSRKDQGGKDKGGKDPGNVDKLPLGIPFP